MNITIGMQNVARELSIEVTEGADAINAVVDAALATGGSLVLTDVQGRRLVVPVAALGYVIVDDKPVGRVGFGL